MSTGSVFSETLQELTITKLDELAKKRKDFEQKREDIATAVRQSDDALAALNLLFKKTLDLFSVPLDDHGLIWRWSLSNKRLESDLRNVEKFISQSQFDPSVSSAAIQKWKRALIHHIDSQSMRYSFADLYGKLTMEWLTMKQSAPPPILEDEEVEDYEHMSGGKRMESRQVWERSVFEPTAVDQSAIVNMLHLLFESESEDSAHLVRAMKQLRQRVSDFEREMDIPQLDKSQVSLAIKGLLNSDLLTDEKRAVLRDFDGNPTILDEIADVLNMRLVSLSTWSWGTSVQLEERRQVNGSFQIHMREDLLQAILLNYIGIKWSVFWKETFSVFRDMNDVWKTPRKEIPNLHMKRRNFYLGTSNPRSDSTSLVEKRIYNTDYFLAHLMDHEDQEFAGVDGEQEAEFEIDIPRRGGRTKQTARKSTGGMAPRKQMTAMRHRKVAPSDDDVDFELEDDEPIRSEPVNLMAAKQKILHLLSTDILVKCRFHGEITCFRSQIDNLYPSLPHNTIKTVLKFFGVSDKWLSFFEKFLKAPLQFADEKATEPRVRMQGTPGSHVLSEVFSEVILFCLDMAINQDTKGQVLWRLQDDIWFWSEDHVACEKAWARVQQFTNVMGLSINESRTGSVRMLQKSKGSNTMTVGDIGKSLPSGQIRWGMLYLNPSSGRFEIDRRMVDKHIKDLSQQLSHKSTSIFSWIQTWNAYATKFFTSNFGKPAHCFGRRHVDDVLATHAHIQKQLFSPSSGGSGVSNSKTGQPYSNVVEFLTDAIEQRFGATNVPEGYVFWPTDLGGLDLESPFIDLLEVRDSILAEPSELLDAFEEAEREAYARDKKAFEERVQNGTHLPSSTARDQFRPDKPETFFSFEEYTRYREVLGCTCAGRLARDFERLLKVPHELGIDGFQHGNVRNALEDLQGRNQLSAIKRDWAGMKAYWKLVALLYGSEIVEKFGGLSIVEQGLLPMGMVSLFRSGSVKWQD